MDKRIPVQQPEPVRRNAAVRKETSVQNRTRSYESEIMSAQEWQTKGYQVARLIEDKYRNPPIDISFMAIPNTEKEQIMLEVHVTTQATGRTKRFIRGIPYHNPTINLERYISQCVHKFLRGS